MMCKINRKKTNKHFSYNKIFQNKKELDPNKIKNIKECKNKKSNNNNTNFKGNSNKQFKNKLIQKRNKDKL